MHQENNPAAACMRCTFQRPERKKRGIYCCRYKKKYSRATPVVNVRALVDGVRPTLQESRMGSPFVFWPRQEEKKMRFLVNARQYVVYLLIASNYCCLPGTTELPVS